MKPTNALTLSSLPACCLTERLTESSARKSSSAAASRQPEARRSSLLHPRQCKGVFCNSIAQVVLEERRRIEDDDQDEDEIQTEFTRSKSVFGRRVSGCFYFPS